MMSEGRCVPNSDVSVMCNLEQAYLPFNEIGMKASIEASSLGGGAVAALFGPATSRCRFAYWW